jgi:hypothetical protein
MTDQRVDPAGAARQLSVGALAELAEQQGIHPEWSDLEAVLGTLSDLASDLSEVERMVSQPFAGQ